jgi:phenylpyruvate tautomerase PptA (4-oxalocrotonate tautomerase family)
MPFIHIKSLPLDDSFDASAVIEGLSEDFAKATGVGVEHVTATWEILPPGYYAVGGKTALHQSLNSHPVLVDLLAPDFNSDESVEKMLSAVSSSISKRANISINNIFINYRQAHSGMVFDSGEIVRW